MLLIEYINPFVPTKDKYFKNSISGKKIRIYLAFNILVFSNYNERCHLKIDSIFLFGILYVKFLLGIKVKFPLGILGA
jgi:hypothetical protein